MTIESPVSLCFVAFGTALSLAACGDFPLRVATYPEGATQIPQGPTPSWDYENTINPATNIRTSGPYDVEDLYRDKDGFALPGDLQIR